MKKILIILLLTISINSSGYEFESISIRDFCNIVSKNDKVNIVISDAVDSSTSIYLHKHEKKLIMALKASLRVLKLRLHKMGNFFYVDVIKDKEPEGLEYYVYTFSSDLYSSISKFLEKVPHTFIPSSNKIVIRVNPTDKEKIFSLFREVDKPKETYMLRFTIFDINRNFISNRRTDLNFISNTLGSVMNTYIDYFRLGSSSASPYLGTSSSSFYAFIDYLDSTNNGRLKTSQFLSLIDSSETVVSNVLQVPVLSQQNQINGNESIATNSYNYVDVGTILTLNARKINGNKTLINYTLENSSIVSSSNSFLPTISKNKTTSSIKLEKGSSIILGGFSRNETFFSDSSIPLLSDIPYIGTIFKGTSEEKKSVSSYIMIEYMSDEVFNSFNAEMQNKGLL